MNEVLWSLAIYLAGFFSKVIFDIYLSGYFKYKKEEWDNRFLKYKEDEFNGYKVRWDYKKSDDVYSICNIQLQCPNCNTYNEDNIICNNCKRINNYQDIENHVHNKLKKKYWKNLPIAQKIKNWVL